MTDKEFSPKHISEALENDPLVKEIVAKIESGELSPSSGPEDYVWTEEDKRRLDEALKKMFASK